VRAAERDRSGHDGGEAGDLEAPRAPPGSDSPNSAKPAAIGIAFVASVAMPAAVKASPCWKAAWRRIVPNA
jgi:hypothetical protein